MEKFSGKMCGLLNLKGQHGVKGEAWSHVRVIAGEAVEKLRQGTEANVDGGDGHEECSPACELPALRLSNYGLQDTVGFHTNAFYFGKLHYLCGPQFPAMGSGIMVIITPGRSWVSWRPCLKPSD